MTDTCALCSKDLNPHDVGTWKEVKGWVGGPRKDSMRLREDTGKFAHDHCVAKLQSGQAVDQPSLLGDALDQAGQTSAVHTVFEDESSQVSGDTGTDIDELEGWLDEG